MGMRRRLFLALFAPPQPLAAPGALQLNIPWVRQGPNSYGLPFDILQIDGMPQIAVYRNGLRLGPVDYTIRGRTVMLFPYDAGDTVTIDAVQAQAQAA